MFCKLKANHVENKIAEVIIQRVDNFKSLHIHRFLEDNCIYIEYLRLKRRRPYNLNYTSLNSISLGKVMF